MNFRARTAEKSFHTVRNSRDDFHGARIKVAKAAEIIFDGRRSLGTVRRTDRYLRNRTKSAPGGPGCVCATGGSDGEEQQQYWHGGESEGLAEVLHAYFELPFSGDAHAMLC